MDKKDLIVMFSQALASAIDETLMEFVSDEQTRGMMRSAILQKWNENMRILLNSKKND